MKLRFFILVITTLLGLELLMVKLGLAINNGSYLAGYEKFISKAIETRKAERRVILVGGSNLSWGVRTDVLSEKLNQPILNAGIHAGVGYKNFFRIVEPYANPETDLIIISPEIETLSASSLFGTKEFCEIIHTQIKSFSFQCIGYTLNKVFRITPLFFREASKYKSSGFNSNGDYIFRSKITHRELGDVCSRFPNERQLSKYYEEIDRIQNLGFEVSYFPLTIPETKCSDMASFDLLHFDLQSRYGNPLTPRPLILAEKFFYDTSYHLEHTGAMIRTNSLFEYLRDIKQ